MLLVAVTTFLAIFTSSLFYASQESLKQQGDYYEATTRPFVGVIADSIKFENTIIDTTKKYTSIDSSNIIACVDSLIQTIPMFTDINYKITNYGSFLANEVKPLSVFSSCVDTTFGRKYISGGPSFSIFPNEPINSFKKNTPIFFDKNNQSYLHIAISYRDMAGKTYHSLCIMLIIFDGKNKSLPPRLIYSYFD